MGIQDRIVFCLDNEMDPQILRGVYYQYRYRPKLYGDYENVSLIVYCGGLSTAWQRIICCKEMVHICDSEVEKTNTSEEIDGLIDRLLGPMSGEDFDVFDIMATKDKLALYQCLPLLLPEHARETGIAEIKSGAKTLDVVAAEACIPVNFAKLILSDEWPSIAKEIGC
ncbi:hypothetical protein BHK69_14050 [Bosea vaviloviae]|uniref:Uncharacterized protein n=2 Tax=Bosea vaviloviae TaxID=1526658 RepID=A0A1D7U228_9HYPH|nr:hypothetical protein BHK69_14050 [Bosea vaviloviae]